MRKTLLAVSSIVLLASVGVSPAAELVVQKPAAEQKQSAAKVLKQTGTIIKIDTAAKTFICKWQTNDWLYQVTDKTVFRKKGKSVDFAELRLDSRVSMTFHMDGKQRVADLVTIEQ